MYDSAVEDSEDSTTDDDDDDDDMEKEISHKVTM
jgi:hypothetical protein